KPGCAVEEDGKQVTLSVASGGNVLPDNQSLGEILRQSPEGVLAWVQHHHAAVECSRDWQDLAYGCGSEAATTSSLSDHEQVALATAAVLIYDRLGQTCTSPSDRSCFVTEGMSL